MSTVQAGVGVGAASARAAVSAPPWVWLAVTGGVIALAVAYCRTQDAEVPDYLDPNQPPINVVPDFSTSLLGQYGTAPGVPAGAKKPRTKYLWNSLMESPCCWVGDC